MLPAVDALAARCRVITGSLPGDVGSIADTDAGTGFESYSTWLDTLLDRAGVPRPGGAVRGLLRRLDRTALRGRPAGARQDPDARLHAVARLAARMQGEPPTWRPRA